MIFTPFSTTVSPGFDPSTLPPVSAARSMITEPGAMPRTASAVISSGAGRPGIWAVVMITSCRFAAAASAPRLYVLGDHRADVESHDDAAEALGRGDRLKPCDTRSEDEHLGGRDRPRR